MKLPILVLKTVAIEVGEDCLELMKLLKKKPEMNEFVIADTLNEDINSVRNKIYRLQRFNLVRSIKKKDPDKGWYVYFWSLIPENFIYVFRKIKLREIEKLEKRIREVQENEYFVCRNGCVTLTSEDALLSNYLCPECGAPLTAYNTEREVLKLKKELERIKQSMDKLQ